MALARENIRLDHKKKTLVLSVLFLIVCLVRMPWATVKYFMLQQCQSESVYLVPYNITIGDPGGCEYFLFFFPFVSGINCYFYRNCTLHFDSLKLWTRFRSSRHLYIYYSHIHGKFYSIVDISHKMLLFDKLFIPGYNVFIHYISP